jgi:aspartate/methionine/tyrosine aminotransferase
MRREQARRNLAVLAGWLAEHQDLVQWVPPQGGVSAFVRFEPAQDVERLCHRLAREHRVLLVPGSCFGHPDHARLGFGGGTAAFEKGLGALSRVLRST